MNSGNNMCAGSLLFLVNMADIANVMSIVLAVMLIISTLIGIVISVITYYKNDKKIDSEELKDIREQITDLNKEIIDISKEVGTLEGEEKAENE